MYTRGKLDRGTISHLSFRSVSKTTLATQVSPTQQTNKTNENKTLLTSSLHCAFANKPTNQSRSFHIQIKRNGKPRHAARRARYVPTHTFAPNDMNTERNHRSLQPFAIIRRRGRVRPLAQPCAPRTCKGAILFRSSTSFMTKLHSPVHPAQVQQSRPPIS